MLDQGHFLLFRRRLLAVLGGTHECLSEGLVGEDSLG